MKKRKMSKLFNSETDYIEAREKTVMIIEDIASQKSELENQYHEMSQRNGGQLVSSMAVGTRVKTAKAIIKANIARRTRDLQNLNRKLDRIDFELEKLREAKTKTNRKERYRREGVVAMAADLNTHFNG